MMIVDVKAVSAEAEEMKEKGNKEYRLGNFESALELLGQAVALVKDIAATEHEETNPDSEELDILKQRFATFLVNRSLCFAALKDWRSSLEEASKVVKVSPKHQKAQFRMVKALIELEDFRSARQALLLAQKHCGETKELKTLEDEMGNKSGVAVRPKSSDFEINSEIGNGNFSTVYKAVYKKTSKLYAGIVWYSVV